jgi:YggT family protein
MFVICLVLNLYLLLLLLRIVISWFPISPGSALESAARGLITVTEPVLGPIRRLLPPARIGGMGLDLSPIIVFLAITVLKLLVGC